MFIHVFFYACLLDQQQNEFQNNANCSIFKDKVHVYTVESRFLEPIRPGKRK